MNKIRCCLVGIVAVWAFVVVPGTVADISSTKQATTNE